MALGRSSSPVARRLTLLAALPLAVTAWVVPAGADPGRPTTSATATAPGSTVQQKVEATYAAYEQAREHVAALSAQADRMVANAEHLESVATQLREQVSDQKGGFFHAIGDLVDPGESDVDRAATAADDAESARQLSDLVQAALADSIAETERARSQWEAAQQRQENVEAKWTARQVVAASIRRSQLPAAYDVSNRAQDRRNRQALRAWHSYLRTVGTAGVVPPPAKKLVDPGHLPAPLETLRGARFVAVPGVAQVRLPDGRRVTVLPTETVRAVSESFHRLGLPDAPGENTATTYACGGLVANAWGAALRTLPADAAAQFQELQAVPRKSLQVGDLVVLGSRKSGLGQTGVYVGQQQAIVANPTTGTAGVQTLPARGVLGVRRPTLPATDTNAAAPAGGTCGISDVVTSSPTNGKGPFVLPMEPGSYHLSAGFGSAGSLWSSGAHTGQDFAAPVGTPVTTAGTGVVSVEHPSWAGNLVRIDHGGGVETLYAHLSRVDVTPGQTVGPGQQVGLVGSLGNTTGPHLHFEVRLDGIAVDPAMVLDIPEKPRPTYTNGEAPSSVLCAATADGAQLLRCDAAVAFRLLGAAFESANGAPLCITDSYRSRLGQERVFITKPNLAAVPGTSVHGWGLAVDLCGGIERFDSTENTWMLAHGAAYGWHHPSWAAKGGSRPEPWHFEYGG